MCSCGSFCGAAACATATSTTTGACVRASVVGYGRTTARWGRLTCRDAIGGRGLFVGQVHVVGVAVADAAKPSASAGGRDVFAGVRALRRATGARRPLQVMTRPRDAVLGARCSIHSLTFLYSNGSWSSTMAHTLVLFDFDWSASARARVRWPAYKSQRCRTRSRATDTSGAATAPRAQVAYRRRLRPLCARARFAGAARRRPRTARTRAVDGPHGAAASLHTPRLARAARYTR